MKPKREEKKPKEKEPDREHVRSVMDTLRELGGKCGDNCGHFDHRGRPRRRL